MEYPKFNQLRAKITEITKLNTPVNTGVNTPLITEVTLCSGKYIFENLHQLVTVVISVILAAAIFFH